MDRFRLDDPDAAHQALVVMDKAFNLYASKNRAMQYFLDAIEQPRLPARSEVEDRLRSALTVARDFIKFHPAVSGEWPIVADLIDKALALGATEDPEPEDVHFPDGTPTHVVHAHLRDAHGNRAPWGYAFSDEKPGETPPRIYGVHAWCHREDGTTDHAEDPEPEVDPAQVEALARLLVSIDLEQTLEIVAANLLASGRVQVTPQ